MKKIKTLLITAQSILIIGITASFSEDPLVSIDVKKTFKLNSLYKFEKTCHDVILFDDETQSFNEYLKTYNAPKINPIESKPNTSFNGKKLIIFTTSKTFSHVKMLISIGADGVISKYAEIKEIREAIIKVTKGEKYFCKNVLALICKGESFNHLFTQREKDILLCLEAGMGYQEIGVNLFISPKTVNRHFENIKRKFGVKKIQDIRSLLQK